MWKAERIKRIDIELTSFCNIHCSGCSRENTRFREDFLNKKENIISLDTIKKKFRKEDWPNLYSINFCGSIDEPTSHPEFLEIVKFFVPWGVNISISTNGSIRSEEWWAELAGILKGTSHSVLWGIDGIDETSEIYRVGSNFKKVQRNFRSFINAGGRSMWQFIVMDHNQHQLEQLEEVAKKEGFISTKIIHSTRKHGDVDYVKPEIEEVDQVECRYLHEGFIFINCLGDVIPCCYWNADHLEYSSPNFVPSKFDRRTQYLELWKAHGGQLCSNLEYNEIVDVIEGDWFDAIAESWFHTPLLDRCEHFCKKKQHNRFEKKVL